MPTSKNPTKAARTEALNEEIAFRDRFGLKRVSMDELTDLIRAVGYRFNKSMSCKSMSRYLTGERAGKSYPNNSLKPVQIDDGLSFSHVDARRDANFERLNEIRNTYYAVHGGYICGW